MLARNAKKDQISLSEQEADLLLRVISTCKFDGKDVFLLSSAVKKLSDFIESK
jgi:hypothetical protein